MKDYGLRKGRVNMFKAHQDALQMKRSCRVEDDKLGDCALTQRWSDEGVVLVDKQCNWRGRDEEGPYLEEKKIEFSD